MFQSIKKPGTKEANPMNSVNALKCRKLEQNRIQNKNKNKIQQTAANTGSSETMLKS